MGWTLTVGGTDRTAVADRTAISLSQTSFRGEVAQAGFDLADDAAAVSLPSLKVVEFAESGTTLWRGRIAAKDVGRGMIFSGSARQYNVTMWDSNADLSGIPVDKWIRPAETDVARALALASAFLNGSPRASTVIGTAHVPNANTVALPAKTYEATTPHEVLAELDEWTGKTHFVIVNGDGSMDLFYAVDTYTGFASSLAISDSAFNDTTILAPIIESPPLTEEGSEIYTGATIIYGDANTRLSATRTTPESLHDYWHIAYWDSEARSSADATNRLAVMLDGAQAEELTYRCQIEVLISQIGNIKCGQTISFRCAAAKVTSATTLRIVRLTWRPPEHPAGPYLVDLELSVPSKTRKRRPPPGAAGTGSGAGGGGGAGHGDAPTPCDDCPPVAGELIQCFFTPWDVDWFIFENDHDTTTLTSASFATSIAPPGGFVGARIQVSSSNPNYAGLNQSSLTVQLPFHMSEPEVTSTANDQMAQIRYVLQFDGSVAAQAVWGWEPDPGTHAPAFFTYLIGPGGTTSRNYDTTFNGDGAVTLEISAGGCTASFDGHTTSGAGVASMGAATGFIQLDVEFSSSPIASTPTTMSAGLIDVRNTGTEAWCTGGTPAPTSGQAVTNEPAPSGDGTTTTFSTQHPYMPSSLFVKVNGVNWTSDIASQDPTTGSFTFTHAPKAGADIVVDYRAA